MPDRQREAEMNFTGERYVPELQDPEISYEHWHRYLFASLFVKQKRVLDIACGEGYGSYVLSEKAKTVVGVDISAESVKHASGAYRRGNLSFIVGGVSRIPIEIDHSIDVIVSLETLEHIDEGEQKAFLSEVKRVLSPKGILILSTPNKLQYSDIPQYKNEFHQKEFYEYEFKEFLVKFFTHVALMGQNIEVGSYIRGEREEQDFFQEYRIRQSETGFHPTEEKRDQRYFIAVCSNGSLPKIPSSFSIDLSRRMITNRDQRIRRLEESLQGLKGQAVEQEQSVQALAAQVAEKEQAVQALQADRTEREKGLTLLKDEFAKRMNAKNVRLEELEGTARTYQAKNQLLLGKVKEQDETIQSLQIQILEICSGASWRVVQWLRRVRFVLAPAGSRREKMWLLGMRGWQVLRDEGLGAFARKVLQKVRNRDTEIVVPDQHLTYPPSREVTSAQDSVLLPEYTPDGNAAAFSELLAISRGQTSRDYVPLAATRVAPKEPPVKLIAFYLPQYHPIPENDGWWGKGFTDWVNVSKSVPQFVGHPQPRLPGELGYYDLRVPDVQHRQVELARQYGIHGFCFYFYWFNGKRLLERPIEQFIHDPQIDFPFCLCWANENWTRRWDGQENDILIAQQHSKEGDHAFIHDIIPFLHHKNYIRVDGRPLLVVYRANILPDPAGTAKRWREDCRQAGLAEPYLVAAQTFGFTDPRKVGFDAAVEFPPHNTQLTPINHAFKILNPDFHGSIYRYTDIVEQHASSRRPPFQLFKTVFPGWDNNPRRPGWGYTFAFSSPTNFQHWLTQAGQFALQEDDPDKRLVFINAWNEWAEGAYLEPDRRLGYAFLQSSADALRALSVDPTQGKPLLRQAIRLESSIKRHDTAVILHLFYPEMWDEIQAHLENLQDHFDLYISIPRSVEMDTAKILGRYPGTFFYRCENRGRDVAPFLSLYSAVYPLNYRYICKIHTKLSRHREDGNAWRQDLYKKLLGSPVTIQASKAILDEHAEVGVIVPQAHRLSSRVYWGKNAANVERLAHLAGIDFSGQEFGFAAGSMFWFRPRALYPLTLLPLSLDDFEVEAGQKDGTLAHAFERMFGLVPHAMGFQLTELTQDGGMCKQPARSTGEYTFAKAQEDEPPTQEINQAPLIIYQMGKVGSVSVIQSLHKAYQDLSLPIPIHHVHVMEDLDRMEAAIRQERKDPAGTLGAIEAGRKLRQQIDSNPNKYWKIISLVREPVARNVATFFQNLREFVPDWEARSAAGELQPEYLQGIFIGIDSIHYAPERWFDAQLKPVFDIDVFASPFPTECGYKIYWSKPLTPLLVIRLEDLNRCAGEAMKEFLGLDPFEVINQNVGDEKPYGGLYKSFKALPLPETYITRMYTSKYARHFYSPEEIIRFSKKWSGLEEPNNPCPAASSTKA
jgi:lipopolysaccharide biosynthesis protein/ubiquinone/menaquinone biosynthesis C-methylase UbiE